MIMIYTIKLDMESCIKTTLTPASFPPLAAVKWAIEELRVVLAS